MKESQQRGYYSHHAISLQGPGQGWTHKNGEEMECYAEDVFYFYNVTHHKV